MISQLMTVCQYGEVKKTSKGQADGYRTDCFIDFAYFEKKLQLFVANLSKQKALDANSGTIQQILFTGKIIANTRVITCHIFE